MSTQALRPETPLADPVSVSCAACAFTDYGRYHAVEGAAVEHARTHGHLVRLYLTLTHVGTWSTDGKFVPAKGVRK